MIYTPIPSGEGIINYKYVSKIKKKMLVSKFVKEPSKFAVTRGD